MDFLNEPFDVESLPRAEEIKLIPIEKSYLTVLRIVWSLFSFILLVISLIIIISVPALHNFLWISFIVSIWLLITVVYFFIQKKSFQQKAYALREKDLLYRTGWLVQRLEGCPFNRIQHSSVNTGFLERKFGLASLVLFTAGTDAADLHIPGLKEADAYAMKEWITQKIIHEEQPG